MSKVRVVIATTEGPAEIDRITPEDAAQSVVCLRRSSQVLPISTGYDAFVRRPSGVIDREFPRAPPSAYRLDVSAPVTNGESWQLGVFIAHALAAVGRLAASGEPCERVIVATGRVDNDLRVQPVDSIYQKAHALRPLLDQLQMRGVVVRLVAPPDNQAEFERAGLPRGIRPTAVDDAWAACAEAGVAAASSCRPIVRPGTESVRPLQWAIGLVALLLACGAVALAPERWPVLFGLSSSAPVPPVAPAATPAPPAVPISEAAVATTPALASDPSSSVLPIGGQPATLAVAALLPPAGATCPQVHMGSSGAVAVPVERSGVGTLAPVRQKPVCGLRFSVVAEKPLHVGVVLRVISGRYVESRRKPALLDGTAAFIGTQSWEISLPSGLAFAYSVTVLVAESALGDDLRLALRLAAAGDELPTTGGGFAVLRLKHEAVP